MKSASMNLVLKTNLSTRTKNIMWCLVINSRQLIKSNALRSEIAIMIWHCEVLRNIANLSILACSCAMQPWFVQLLCNMQSSLYDEMRPRKSKVCHSAAE